MVALGVSRFGINTKTAVDLVRECAALPGGRLILSDAA
jgi:deoxyribose-phosphate aldolase